MITGGAGPDSVTGKTYFEIQIEQGELDGSIRSRKPGLEEVVQPPGTYPRIPGGYVWDADRRPGNGGKDD